MGQVHAVDRESQLLSHINWNHVVVLARTVIYIVDDGRLQVVEDVPWTIIAHPIRIGRHIIISDVAHVTASILKSVSSTVLLALTHDNIHLSAFRQLLDKAGRNAKRITNGNRLHGLKLSRETDWSRRWIGFIKKCGTFSREHLLFREIVQLSPVRLFGFLSIDTNSTTEYSDTNKY